MNIDIIGDFVNYYDDSINDVTPFICSLLKGIRNSVFHKRKNTHTNKNIDLLWLIIKIR